MKDEMKIGDQPPRIEIKCAVCGEVVQPGEKHSHEKGEKKHESTSGK